MSTKGSSSVEIEVTDDTGKEIKLKNFQIQVPVGDSETDLFLRPKKVNDHDKPQNEISCMVSDEKRFKIQAAGTPTAENHILMFQITNIEKPLQALKKVTLTFTGTANTVKGVANIKITEIVEKGKDDKDDKDDPSTDRVANLKVEKKDQT